MVSGLLIPCFRAASPRTAHGVYLVVAGWLASNMQAFGMVLLVCAAHVHSGEHFLGRRASGW